MYRCHARAGQTFQPKQQGVSVANQSFRYLGVAHAGKAFDIGARNKATGFR